MDVKKTGGVYKNKVRWKGYGEEDEWLSVKDFDDVKIISDFWRKTKKSGSISSHSNKSRKFKN